MHISVTILNLDKTTPLYIECLYIVKARFGLDPYQYCVHESIVSGQYKFMSVIIVFLA